MQLRKASQEDLMFLFNLRNHPQVRAASFNPDPIELEAHRHWLARKLQSANSLLLIAEVDGRPAGQVRLDQTAEATEAEIHIAVDPERHGQGLGSRILSEACAHALETGFAHRVLAHIQPDNHGSIRAFEKAGFSFGKTVTADRQSYIEMVWEGERS